MDLIHSAGYWTMKSGQEFLKVARLILNRKINVCSTMIMTIVRNTESSKPFFYHQTAPVTD